MSEWRREKAYHLATELMADINDYPRWQEDKDALEESIFKGLEEAEARGARKENEARALWKSLAESYENLCTAYRLNDNRRADKALTQIEKIRARMEEK